MGNRLSLLALAALTLLLATIGDAAAQCTGTPGANLVCASPNGVSGIPGWRALVPADLPGTGIIAGTTPVTSGTSGRLFYNNAGIFTEFTAGGDCTFSAPNFTCTKTNGSAFAPSATTNALNASNISSGTLPAARLGAGFLVAGTGLTGGSLAGGGTVAADIASTTQIQTATPNKLIAADKIWVAETLFAYNPSITFDFNAILSNAVILLTGNITSIGFANIRPGVAGLIRFVQDGTGGRTIPPTITSSLKCPGGCNYVLSTAPNAQDLIPFQCIATTLCIGGPLLKDIR